MSSRLRKYLPAAVLIALGIICYANSFQNEFVWDDNLQIKQNRLLRSWSFLPRYFTSDMREAYGSPNEPVSFYRPLWMASQLVDYQLWGPQPFGFHLTNFLLHVGNVLLVWTLLRTLAIERRWALLVSTLWLVHPCHLETTTFIAGRTYEMCVLFMLIVLIFFVNLIGNETATPNQRRGKLLAAMFCYALALLSKESAVTLPAILLAICMLLPTRRRTGAWVVIPFVVVLLAYLSIRTMILSNPGFPHIFSFTDRLVLVCRSLAAHVGLTVVPVNLHVNRTLLIPGWQGTALTVAGLATLSGLAALVGWFRRRDWRVSFGIVMFFVAWSLTSNIVPLNTVFGERWLYWPMVGLLIATAAGAQYLHTQHPHYERFTLAFGWLLVLLFSVQTIVQNRVWRDEASLYETAIARGGDHYLVRTNLAVYYMDRGDLTSAKRHLDQALKQNPQFVSALWGMGSLLTRQQHYQEASKFLERALQLNPANQPAAVWLAFAQEQLDQLLQAERTLQQSRARVPTSVAALKLANLLYRHDRLDEAEQVLRDILQLDSRQAEALNSLGTVLYRRGKTPEAEQCFAQAVRYDRGLVDAHANLAALAAERGDLAQAVNHYQEALALAPQNAQLHYALATVLSEYGRVEDATRSAQRALELDPQFDRAKELLDTLTTAKAK